MRDHKDITDHSAVPHLRLTGVRALSRDECLAYAEYHERLGRNALDLYHAREARAWRKLAGKRPVEDVPAERLELIRQEGRVS